MTSRPPSPLAARLRARRARHKRRPRPIRVLVGAVGFLITFAGILMLVLPGPALVVIPLGLAVLALEFPWAERALHSAVERAEAARRRAAGASFAQRLVSVAAFGLAAAAAVAAAVVWDVPYLPV